MPFKIVIAALAAALAAMPAIGNEPVSPAVLQLHERMLVLDTHLDTPSNLHRPGWSILEEHSHEGDFAQVDLPRMKQGGLDGGFWVVYTAQGLRDEAGNRAARDHGLNRLVAIREMVAANPAEFELALTAKDAVRIEAAGKRVVYISMENASPLAADPTLLSAFHALGLRMLGITHTRNNQFGDSSTDPTGPEWGGLSPAGRALVQEANRLGILIDGSHASDETLDQLLVLSKSPVVLSHTSADAVHEHARNIDDAMIRRLADQGGVIHVNALGAYLVPTPTIEAREKAKNELRERFGSRSDLTAAQVQEWRRAQAEIDRQFPIPQATFEDYMRHLLHILEIAGPGHVGIGADWDGGGGVAGLDDVSQLPRITERLLKAGYSESDIAKIWSGNLLRILSQAQAIAEGSTP